MKRCPFCAEEIQDAARVCRFCNADLVANVRVPTAAAVIAAPPSRSWHPGVAAVLSLVIPGAGQIYKGKVGSGLAWLFGVVVGYLAFIVPGIVLHIACILAAASGSPAQVQATSVAMPPPLAPQQRASVRRQNKILLAAVGILVAVVVGLQILGNLLSADNRRGRPPSVDTAPVVVSVLRNRADLTIVNTSLERWTDCAVSTDGFVYRERFSIGARDQEVLRYTDFRNPNRMSLRTHLGAAPLSSNVDISCRDSSGNVRTLKEPER